MQEKTNKRGTNPNSLKALKESAASRKCKKYVKVGLLPHTISLLDSTGNRSGAIDEAIALIEKYGLMNELLKQIKNPESD
ncbi:hypothetical protein AB0758_49340 [Tolypothrix bouteillei VB521301_2]|uniref:hypothetical protein n=1 Tax=Tolypothrix bouteillei TaxID=1246981 RepID=UPI000513F5F1